MIYSVLAPEVLTEERCFIRELFNSPLDDKGSIAQARVLPGVATANHLLLDTTEWYYLIQGTGKVFLNNQLTGTVKTGDTVHIPAGTPQYILNDGEEDLIFLCFCSPAFHPDNYQTC
jgi:mannose-6-phosphate isomerase-like protein (cupin superfamily)